jgi:hypothetical protein
VMISFRARAAPLSFGISAMALLSAASAAA